MTKQKTISAIIILVLLAGNILLAAKYYVAKKELRQTQSALAAQQTNEKILSFTNLFIEEVLKADTEVSFETRLELENAVRNLDDPEILAQWQKFTKAQTQDDAQAEVKNLLGELISKIKVK